MNAVICNDFWESGASAFQPGGPTEPIFALMNTRQNVQRLSAGLVIGGEAVGALVLHESNSLAVTAPIVIGVILLTVWLLDAGVDQAVKHWNWMANLVGVKPRSKVKIHGWWYSAIRDQRGQLLGGSIFRIQAGVDEVRLTGAYKDLTVTPNKWTWWLGVGSPFGEDDILYGYKGVEDGTEDEGFGRYSFPSGSSPPIIRGSFYGKNLPETERYRTADGERVLKADVTREFIKKAEVRQQALERYLERSASLSSGRATWRRSTASWWRRTRISTSLASSRRKRSTVSSRMRRSAQ